MGGALTLDAAGSQAAPVASLTHILLWGGAAIMLLVLVLLAVALAGPARWRSRMASERFVLGLGFAFPVVVLSVLLVVGLTMTSALGKTPENSRGGDPLTVRITGYRWWWSVRYPDFLTANELVIPAGRPVMLQLAAADVIHSFWVPQLAGKRDMIPGKLNRLLIEAERPGEYFAICAEYCGGPHALMQFRVRALTPAAFDAWAANQRRAAAVPASLAAQEGEGLFRRLGCGGCHRVAGTGQAGSRGPDLTHVASRTRIGAGILPNTAANLRGFTANAHAYKPGVVMPPFDQLQPSELDALAAYLAGLK